ncbi:MAG: hypothetical protein L7U83_10120 [Akkermansiaceae bacterium]|nr:hypothetical protein [Akkermansiaceae bacterium]
MSEEYSKLNQIIIEQELANKAADNEAVDPMAIATMENWIISNNLAEAATLPVREEDSTSNKLFAKHAHLFDPNPSKIHKPSSDAELKDREIGGLWPHPNPKVKGEKMFKGTIKINGEHHDVVYFKNKYYAPKTNKPEYRIYWNLAQNTKALIK